MPHTCGFHNEIYSLHPKPGALHMLTPSKSQTAQLPGDVSRARPRREAIDVWELSLGSGIQGSLSRPSLLSFPLP